MERSVCKIFIDYCVLISDKLCFCLKTLIGKDKSVVLWSIQDHISALGDSSSSPGASGSKQSGKTATEKESPKVDPRGIFHGHDSTVEDVQFCPSRYVALSVFLVAFKTI